MEIPPIPAIAKYFPKIYDITVCRITTDEGLEGAGECQGTPDLIRRNADDLVGQDPLAIDPFGQRDIFTCALLDIAGWEVTVYLHNPEDLGGGGPALPSEDLTLRVRLYYPQEGELDWPETWPPSSTERDEATYLSDAIIVPTGSVTDGTALTLQFNFGEDTKLIPFGVRSLGIVSDQDGTAIGDASQDTWRVNLLSRMKLRPEAVAWNLE